MNSHFYRHKAKFELGRCVITPAAITSIIFNDTTPTSLLNRHVQGDWGDLEDEDKALNDKAILDGSRIVSAYTLADRTALYIITEADRSATTILLRSEY